jgi:hypothetical protein
VGIQRLREQVKCVHLALAVSDLRSRFGQGKGPYVRLLCVKGPHPKMAFSVLLEDKANTETPGPAADLVHTGQGASVETMHGVCPAHMQAHCCHVWGKALSSQGLALQGLRPLCPSLLWFTISPMRALPFTATLNPQEDQMRSLCRPYSQNSG